MRHVQITALLIRLIGLALIVHLLRKHFDVGFYSDEPAFPNLSREPSFRFVGVYLLHASHGFHVAAFCLGLLGALLLVVLPRRFARLLWAGITLTDDTGPGR